MRRKIQSQNPTVYTVDTEENITFPLKVLSIMMDPAEIRFD
jgi:hypothetical protein